MTNKPDDDLQLDGVDDVTPAGGAPPARRAAPTTPDAEPQRGAFAPLRRRDPNEDDASTSRMQRPPSTSKLKKGKVLGITAAVLAAVIGTYFGGKRVLRSFSGTDSSRSEADLGPTDLERGFQTALRARVMVKKDGEDYQCPPGTDRYTSTFMVPAPRTWRSSQNAGTEPQQNLRNGDPYELECAGPDGKKISIGCMFNFEPPDRFTAACNSIRGEFDGNPALLFVE